MRMKSIYSAFAAALFLSAPLMAKTQPADAVAPRPGYLAPDFTLSDAVGKSHTLSAYRGKWVVLEWVNYDCPFVKKHYSSGNMQKHQKAAREKGAVWLSINSSASGKQGHYEGEELKMRLEGAEGQGDAYLLDTDGKAGKSYKAKTTPHMFVIDPAGKVVYAGAIDDRPTVDKADLKDAENYVAAALEAGMAGKPVKTATSTAYGCGIKY